MNANTTVTTKERHAAVERAYYALSDADRIRVDGMILQMKPVCPQKLDALEILAAMGVLLLKKTAQAVQG